MSKEKENIDPNKIDGSPQKNLFISMLVKDLTLRDAIGDLIDNSVDGARNLMPLGKFSGLKIDIIINEDEFIIKDNCGGFSVDDARNYAFCFGKKDDDVGEKGTIGHFGIGMKRALFKMGNYFDVKSTYKNSQFEMDENVDHWKRRKEWDFKFKTDPLEDIKPYFTNDKRGTTITVKDLREEVKVQFSDKNFIKKLKEEIELEHLFTIHKGLQISINKVILSTRELDFIDDKGIKPGYWKKKYGKLNVELYVGASSDKGEEGGWYIFCNDRLIKGPETTQMTGWTGRKGDGVAEYHDQFHRFRGYAFFSSDDSGTIPWNTTKNGMDMDSAIYKDVRIQMIEMMRPVMTFCNILKTERGGTPPIPESERILNSIVNSAKIYPLLKIIDKPIKLNSKFEFPLQPKKPKEDAGKQISYKKPEDQIDAAKEYFGLTSNKEVGEKTFDYFYEMEINK